MARLLAAIVCTFLLAAPALAQEGMPPPEDEETLVLFSINAPLTEPMPRETELPVALLQQLSEEPALVQLDLRGTVGDMMLRGRFAFESMGAFVSWYGSEATQELLQELGTLAPHMEYSFRLRRAGEPAGSERQL